MATWGTADRTAASEASTEEGPAEEQLLQTPDRRHVDNLLDISEEGFLKDLEPHEHHPYSGWEEAVSILIYIYTEKKKILIETPHSNMFKLKTQ